MLTKYFKWSFFVLMAAAAVCGIVFIIKGHVTGLDFNLPGNMFKYEGPLSNVFMIPASIMGIWGFVGAIFKSLSPYKVITRWSDGSKTEEQHSGLQEWVIGLFVAPLVWGGLTYAILYYVTYSILSVLLIVLPFLLGALLIAGVVIYGWRIAFVDDNITAEARQLPLWAISIVLLILISLTSFCIYNAPSWSQSPIAFTENEYHDDEDITESNITERIPSTQPVSYEKTNSSNTESINTSTVAVESEFVDYSSLVCNRRLTNSDLSDKDKATLRIMRNTIYARHGYIFKSKDLNEYFKNFSWYVPSKSVVEPNELSDIETANIILIQKHE